MSRSRFVVLFATLIVALSALLVQAGPVLGRQGPDADRGDNNDPDRPPIGKDLKPKLYVRMRQLQIAYYRGYPFTLKYDARGEALAMMRSQQRALGIPIGDVTPDTVVPATTPVWTPIGPAPIPNGQVAGGATNIPVSGRVTAIAVDPGDANDVYVGTAQGGLYRSTNGGTSWTPMMDSAASLSIGALAFAPSDHSKLYIGTGEGNLSGDSYSGVGLYRIDGANGGSPTLHGPFEQRVAGTGTSTGGNPHAFLGVSITSIAVDPNNAAKVFIGTTLGVVGKGNTLRFQQTGQAGSLGLWFTDNGTSNPPHFSRVLGAPSGSDGLEAITDAVFVPGSSSTLIIGVEDFETGATSGIYRSTNAGTATIGASGVSPTFSQSKGESPNLRNIRFGISKPGSGAAVVFAGREGGSPGGVLLRSTNGGVSFPDTISNANGFCTPQCYYDIVVTLDPTDVSKLYLGGSADANSAQMFERSTNAGAAAASVTFTASDTKLHADTHAIAVAPSNTAVVYEGNDGGIFKSTNSGATWTSLNNGQFSATQFQSIAVLSSTPNVTLGGTQDNGTNFYNGSWDRADFGDGGFTLIDQNGSASNLTMYHTYFNATNNLIALARYTGNPTGATDGAWSDFGCGSGVTVNNIDCHNNVLFYAPMALGPGTPNTLYFGTDRLYRSPDQGVTMSVVGTVTGNPFATDSNGSIPVSAIGIAPSDDNVRMVGLSRGGKVFRTTSGAPTTWTDVTGPWQSQFIGRTVIDPTNADTAYVTLDGFSGGTGAGKGHVWKTSNLSAATPTWNEISSGLPDVPVNGFVIDPATPSDLFAGTDIGVYQSTDGGTSWNPFGAGLPDVAVFDLAISTDGSGGETLRIATHGKGMWQIPISTGGGGGDTTPPVPSMDQPSLVYNASKTIALAWSATDTSGIQNYDVRVRKAQYTTSTFGGFTNIAALQATGLTSANFTAAPGFTYCFSMRARDASTAHNLSTYSPEKCTFVPVDDKTLTHSAGWTQKSNQAGDYLGTISSSTTKGKTLTLTGVHAKQIGILANGCTGCGAFSITFGGKTFTANLNLASGHYIFETTAFSSIKTGTLTLKVTSSTSAGHKVQIDGLVTLIKGAFAAAPPGRIIQLRQVH